MRVVQSGILDLARAAPVNLISGPLWCGHFGGRRPRARVPGSGDGSSFLGLARPLGAWFALALKFIEQPFRFICWEHAANLARRHQRHLVGGELVAVGESSPAWRKRIATTFSGARGKRP
jgi:hypothetical protein